MQAEIKGHGYRHNEDNIFPFQYADSGIWFTLTTIVDGKINMQGFRSSKTDKRSLIKVLSELEDKESAVLGGLWQGQYSTDMFILDIEKTIERLKEVI